MAGVGERIRAARQMRGWSQTKLAERVNQAQTTLSSWERNRTEPTREDVQRIAAELEVPVAALELDGSAADAPDSVAVMGYVGAGSIATLYAEGQGPFDYVAAPRDSTKETVALEIRGASLGAAFDDGLVFYDDVRSPVTPDLHGRLCVVALAGEEQGRVLVKILRPAAEGRFHLLSNAAEEPPLRDREVLWAARVKEVRPR